MKRAQRTTGGMLTIGVLALALAGCEQGQHQWDHPADPEPVPAQPDPGQESDAGSAATDAAQPIDPEPVPYAGEATEPEGRTYTVREGDTYWSIAVRLYQDGQMAEEIQRLNPDVDPNALSVGQEIRVP